MKPTSAAYVERCKALNLRPDLSILSCLETESFFLQISPSSQSILPLVPLLSHNHHHVTEIKLLPDLSTTLSDCMTQGSQDVNLRCLCEILSQNTTITKLDLSRIGISENGVKLIADMLATNRTLTHVDLSHNFQARLAFKKYLAKALRTNTSLQDLNLSSNRLGFDIVTHLKKWKRKTLHLNVAGNNVIEETLNAGTHLVGLWVSQVGILVLLYQALGHHRLFAGCLVYSITLFLMFFSSALFHAKFDSHVEEYEFYKMCDHSAIYLLIAGSLTPFVVQSHSRAALFVSVFQWLAAFWGIAFGMYASHHHLKHKLKIEMLVNFSQGFSTLWVVDDLLALLGEEPLFLLKLSGLCYVVGAIFFVAEHTVHPLAHAIWHLFVIAGACTHYFAVFQFVVKSAAH